MSEKQKPAYCEICGDPSTEVDIDQKCDVCGLWICNQQCRADLDDDSEDGGVVACVDCIQINKPEGVSL